MSIPINLSTPVVLQFASSPLVDVVGIIANCIVGLTGIVAIGISIYTLIRSEWLTLLSTSPSLVFEIGSIDLWSRASDESGGLGVQTGDVFNKGSKTKIQLVMELSLKNVGRGAAFNIRKARITSGNALLKQARPSYIPKGKDEGSFEVTIDLSVGEWIYFINKKEPVVLTIDYSNDQGNVFSRTTFSVVLTPFEVIGNGIKANSYTLEQSDTKIKFSRKPFNN